MQPSVTADEVVRAALEETHADWFEPREDAAERVLDALHSAGFCVVPARRADPMSGAKTHSEPPVCEAGHGPMSLLPSEHYRRLHVCTECGRSAFSDEVTEPINTVMRGT